jgi:hypothetical protein
MMNRRDAIYMEVLTPSELAFLLAIQNGSDIVTPPISSDN